MKTMKRGAGWVVAKFAGRRDDFCPVLRSAPVSAPVRARGMFLTILLLGILTLGQLAAQAQTNLVNYDSGTGGVTFIPGLVVTPIITGVIAAIGAGAALLILTVGIRWVYRTIKGSK